MRARTSRVSPAPRSRHEEGAPPPRGVQRPQTRRRASPVGRVRLRAENLGPRRVRDTLLALLEPDEGTAYRSADKMSVEDADGAIAPPRAAVPNASGTALLPCRAAGVSVHRARCHRGRVSARRHRSPMERILDSKRMH